MTRRRPAGPPAGRHFFERWNMDSARRRGAAERGERMSDYQLIVIGAGPGGYTAALRAAKLGRRTAIVERREVGGTCLNRGCIPTKALLHAAEIAQAAREGGRFGVEAGEVRVDLAAAYRRKNEVYLFCFRICGFSPI